MLTAVLPPSKSHVWSKQKYLTGRLQIMAWQGSDSNWSFYSRHNIFIEINQYESLIYGMQLFSWKTNFLHTNLKWTSEPNSFYPVWLKIRLHRLAPGYVNTATLCHNVVYVDINCPHIVYSMKEWKQLIHDHRRYHSAYMYASRVGIHGSHYD